MSAFGHWITVEGLPAFRYTTSHETRRWVSVGNRRIQAVPDSAGTVALWDEHDGLRWITRPDPTGTGRSVLEVEDGPTLRTGPSADQLERTFGPTWFRVAVGDDHLRVERTTLCPEGEAAWVLVRVRITAGAATRVRHTEEWHVVPGYVNMLVPPPRAQEIVRQHVRFDVAASPRGLGAVEMRPDATGAEVRQILFGDPAHVVLEALGDTQAEPGTPGTYAEPTLTLATEIVLAAHTSTDLWFRFGLDDGSPVDDPAALFDDTLRALRGRLPRAGADQAEMAAREIPWHAALLTGGACSDRVLGGHTLDEGSIYSHVIGLNIAARDPLQHAIPLIYIEPDLALSVLRNTCSWTDPSGFLPWALNGSKAVASGPGLPERPSDVHLWALWLASEYAIATGDVAAFERPVGFHPSHRVDPVSLFENLRRQFRHFVDDVGLGENGHVRILSCDWADGFVGAEAVGIDRATLAAKGESVMNSAMAAWILPLWAHLCRRLGDHSTSDEATALASALRAAVARDWNGRWFRRAFVGDVALGDDRLFLEPQSWAILCGAADGEQATALLGTIDELLRNQSPLGARQQWPTPGPKDTVFEPGEGLAGGVWFALNGILVWAASRHAPEMAWDEWRRLSLSEHANAYPEVWEGTLSGPDAYNAPESPRPGETFGMPGLEGASFTVDNMHSHSQPLLAYLRLLGVEPTAEGNLRTGGGATIASPTFTLRSDGTGRLSALGPVALETRSGIVAGGPGEVVW